MMAYICRCSGPFHAIAQSYYGLGIQLLPPLLFFCHDLMCQHHHLGWLTDMSRWLFIVIATIFTLNNELVGKKAIKKQHTVI